MFDVLIIGGGVSGISCALVLGSAGTKPFAATKKIGVFTHQKASSLQDAVFNNAYGIPAGKLGSELLTESTSQLAALYPQVIQLPDIKILRIEGEYPHFTLFANDGTTYEAQNVVIAIGAGNPFTIAGLEEYVMPHQKANPAKNRLQLRNSDHLVKPGIYVSGTLAGWRSQLPIAAGSGASVATDILTAWNGGEPVQIHDSTRVKP
ncbi:FAD-dependent oxidoreductase [Flavobacterium stagni]|uniref:NAD(P)/FAD-dependent oxidoreductase n=1 Tax=Flavobacterium stagni TaxID=2506421 RepID=A0A4Q1KBA3_9FLAO|nr:FAD-dependent oxidoreductase [Flavobacterium stagni]RXR24137.1 NAD(P)/FAD-dependent oxidoreductase [Flavobacterium stagni]